MADRTLVNYTEDRNSTGPFWTLEISRSASGKGTILVTITHSNIDGKIESSNTIVVENAAEVLKPVNDWLKTKESDNK